MPRKSSITRLDPAIRAEVDKLVRDGGHTIDEIVSHLRTLGGDASRSAVGRYVKRAEEQFARYREAQEVAKTWIGKLEEDPQGDVGRLLAEMLRTVAFSTLGAMDDKDGSKPMEIMLLAKAIKDLASADKTSVDRELRVRREAATKAADTAVKAARKNGLSKEAADDIRREILGITA